jgi:predicted ATP-dependent endonuclease of OLD family
MKITNVIIKRFKALKDFNANLDGKNVLIMGENGVGKSTFLQAISIALGNKKQMPSDVNGEWQVWADRDGREWKFKVKMKDGKAEVQTESPEGVRDIRVSALKEITGAVDFDIDEFVGWSESESGRKKQVETYKNLFPREIRDEIEKHELKVKSDYSKRTDVNRDIKILKGAIEDHPLLHKNVTLIPIDTSAIQDKINKASEHNNKVGKIQSGVDERNRQAEEIQAQIEELLKKKEEVLTEAAKGKEWLKTNKEISITDLTQELTEANQNNSQIDSYKELQKKKEQLEKFEEQSGDLTALIDSSKQLIADTIKDIGLPVEGLAYDEEKLFYNGIPVEIGSMSTSEIIELGIKMKIVENPDLPLIIKRAESLGTKRFKEILEIAEKNNMQVIAEEVERGNEKLTIKFIGGE